MANLLNYDASQLLGFILVLIRVGAILGTAPIFGSAQIPVQIRLVLMFILALVIYPFVPAVRWPLAQVPDYLFLVMQELFVGFALGLVGRILFAVIEFAGEMTGLQMGLSMAMIFDPQSGQQKSIISELERILATLIFLAMDAHHVAIQAVVRSYELIGPGQARFPASLAEALIQLSGGIFVLGFQLGAPLIISLFLANVILGLLERAVPQMHLFTLGFPLTILLGFLFLILSMPFFIQAVVMLFERFDDHMMTILQLLS